MPLNRPRRIFRPAGLLAPRRSPALPATGVALALAVGLIALAGGAWLVARPSQAPARAPILTHVSAPAAQVAVIDGSTLRLQDRVVRLDGIDAPGRDAICSGPDNNRFACGVAATNALAALVRNGEVACTLRQPQGANRPVADCVVRGTDINQALVRDGWARADPAQPALVGVEAEAWAARRGLWAGGMVW